jgi:hypothetical protein
MLVSAALLFVASVVISLRVNAESERKWCSVVITLDDAWRESPPTTPSGKNMAANIAELRHELHCPTTTNP